MLSDFEIYLKSKRVKRATLRTYVPEANRFLKSVKGDEFDESDGRAYLANLYSMRDNTARKIYYAMAALFKSQKIPFEMEPPQMEANPFQPTIKQDEMVRLITAIKETGDSEEKGCLSLSSIYGLRRIEIKRASETDIDLDKGTIRIHTAKGGRERVHLIPEEIVDYITGYEFVPKSDQGYADLFWRMVKKADLNLQKGFGFHSIRRALFTNLTGKTDLLLNYEYLRWKIRGLNIAMIYNQTPPAEIDKKIFEVHPFLPAWK